MENPLKKMLLLPAVAALMSCNTPSFRVVTVKPIYGWTDGCTEVRVSGSGFDEASTLSVGGTSVDVIARGEGADAGYWVNAYTPPSSTGASGDVDVTLTSAGESGTITGGFHYVQCPEGGTVDNVYASATIPEPYDPWTPAAPSSSVTSGTDVTITGCGIDFTSLKVKLVSEADGTEANLITPTQTCGTGVGHFTVPTLTDGAWDVLLVDANDTIFYPSDYGCVPDTGAGISCLPVYAINYSTGG